MSSSSIIRSHVSWAGLGFFLEVFFLLFFLLFFGGGFRDLLLADTWTTGTTLYEAERLGEAYCRAGNRFTFTPSQEAGSNHESCNSHLWFFGHNAFLGSGGRGMAATFGVAECFPHPSKDEDESVP
jgi:hypothetical protein